MPYPNIMARRGAQKAENDTVADYDTLAEMEYAFIVWRTNLKRDLSLTDDHEVRHRGWGRPAWSAPCALHAARGWQAAAARCAHSVSTWQLLTASGAARPSPARRARRARMRSRRQRVGVCWQGIGLGQARR